MVPDTYRCRSTTYEPHLVAGELSITRDHVRYERDWGQTMPLVFARLLAPKSPEPIGYLGVRPALRRVGPLAVRDLAGVILRLVPWGAALAAAVSMDLFWLGLWIWTVTPDVFTSTAQLILVPLTAISGLLRQRWSGWLAPETLLGGLTVAALAALGSIAVRRTLSFFQDRETRRWLRTQQWGQPDPAGRWGRLRWSAALAVVTLVAALLPALFVWNPHGPALTPRQTVEAYLTAAADDDLRRLCTVTTGSTVERDVTPTCAMPGGRELGRICKDARMAIANLDDDAVRVDQGSVNVTWTPELRPVCGTNGSVAVPIPSQVVRVKGRWRVSEVA